MSLPSLSCTILGGANGSGKSTIYSKLHLDGELVNADLVARQIAPDNPESATEAAGRRVIQRLRELLSARESFVYETTLSSHQSIKLMQRAREAGYSAQLHALRLIVGADAPAVSGGGAHDAGAVIVPRMLRSAPRLRRGAQHTRELRSISNYL